MNKQIIDSLKAIAEEFGATAKKVNESSKLRVSHSETALNLIDKSIEMGEVIEEDLESVAKANLEMRNKDNVVINSCILLKRNVDKQNELIKEMKNVKSVNQEIIEQCSEKIGRLSKDIDQALENINKIVEMDNKIIFMEKEIIMRKQFQQSSLRMLNEITTMSQHDAEKAVEGSSSNLARGLSMVKRFKEVDRLASKDHISELRELLKEANKGWNTAVEVNNSSTSQFKFAEEVNQFTRQLHRDSTSIKDMVAVKHGIFEDNLQMITVLTVILSLKFKKYLEMEELIERIEFRDDILDLLNQFIIDVKIACNDIRELNALNYDMADASHLNNEVEDKAVRATKKEMEYFDSIKKEVEEMTEATKYPIEGSSKNINNGKKLEEDLNKLIEQLK